ncbi:DUF3899 domain-containing protein [Macrococcus equi]|uniref:DUF3899 domain-containing protein n=1 Tax=Macrococcus equi TaxID=3395462 RepID=UPI0039BEB989
MKNYIIILFVELVISLLYTILKGLNLIHFVNGLFSVSLLGLCIGLFMMMYGDGAYSIMGHSFRKFNYMMAPKRVKETMDEDPGFSKDLHIRQERYALTQPILFTSLGCLILSLVVMYFI